MDTPIKDGGPAFPHAVQKLHSSYATNIPGMSLRDWFAGRAMQASYLLHMEGTRNVDKTAAALASEAYAVADAMIAARNIPPNQ